MFLAVMEPLKIEMVHSAGGAPVVDEAIFSSSVDQKSSFEKGKVRISFDGDRQK